jgi:hypothetical protein
MGRNELYQKLYSDDYPDVIPHSDPTIKEVDDKVLINIRKYCLHFVLIRTLVILCS